MGCFIWYYSHILLFMPIELWGLQFHVVYSVSASKKFQQNYKVPHTFTEFTDKPAKSKRIMKQQFTGNHETSDLTMPLMVLCRRGVFLQQPLQLLQLLLLMSSHYLQVQKLRQMNLSKMLESPSAVRRQKQGKKKMKYNVLWTLDNALSA